MQAMKFPEMAVSISPVVNKQSWNYLKDGQVESGLDKVAVLIKLAKVHVKLETAPGFYNAKALEANHQQLLLK